MIVFEVSLVLSVGNVLMRALTASVLFLIASSSSAQEVFDKALNAGLRPGLIVRLDEVMSQQVEQEQIAGVAMLIARDGKIGYDRVIGFRDLESKEPMTKDTIFWLASMAKPLVAVTAMTLWEEGRFKLDDPISDVLPEWKDVKVKQGQTLVPADKPITPRMLMTHSSGIEEANWNALPGRPINAYAMNSDEFSKTLAARPLLDQPGTKYHYGWSISILGRYLELLEGKSLDVVMQERLLGPLKMKDTWFWMTNEEDLARLATLYMKDDEGKLVPHLPGPFKTVRARNRQRLKKPVRMEGAGAMCGTLEDYYRFAQMLASRGELDGTRVLKPKTVDLIFQVHFPRKDARSYGLGAAVDEKGNYSWGGSGGTGFWANSRNKSCGVFMIQTFADEKPSLTFYRLGGRAASW